MVGQLYVPPTPKQLDFALIDQVSFPNNHAIRMGCPAGGMLPPICDDTSAYWELLKADGRYGAMAYHSLAHLPSARVFSVLVHIHSSPHVTDAIPVIILANGSSPFSGSKEEAGFIKALRTEFKGVEHQRIGVTLYRAIRILLANSVPLRSILETLVRHKNSQV